MGDRIERWVELTGSQEVAVVGHLGEHAERTFEEMWLRSHVEVVLVPRGGAFLVGLLGLQVGSPARVTHLWSAQLGAWVPVEDT